MHLSTGTVFKVTECLYHLKQPHTPFVICRAGIFLRMADLLATKYRPMILATTMVGQAKTIQQAEIDAACEVIDFFRFAVQYAANLYKVCCV